jgi:hypothetical protein
MMRRHTKHLLWLVPIVLLIIALLVPAMVSAAPGKAVSDKAAVHSTIYYQDTGATYNVIYHAGDPGKMTVTGAIYPKSGPLKGK